VGSEFSLTYSELPTTLFALVCFDLAFSSPFWQRCFEPLLHGKADLAELCPIIVFNRVERIEHSGIDSKLYFLREPKSVLEIAGVHDAGFAQRLKPLDNEVKRTIQQEHQAINVLPLAAGKLWSSQVCLL
jgi:hypothetical protein